METIPFTLDEGYGGLAKTDGMMRLESDALVLEFQTKDSIVGLLKSEVKEVRIPFSEIESAHFKKGFHGLTPSHLTFSLRSMKYAGAIPGVEQGALKLPIAKQHREAAARLASTFTLQQSQQQLEQMKRELNELPPG